MSDSSELLGPGTWVQHGPATLVIRDAGWVVLIPGTRKEVIEAAWTVLGTSPSGQEFLDRLLEAAEIDGVDKLAALLFAITDGTSVTFGDKGKTPIAVYTGEGSQQIAGTEEEPFVRSEEHTSELQSRGQLVCRRLLEKKKEGKLQ